MAAHVHRPATADRPPRALLCLSEVATPAEIETAQNAWKPLNLPNTAQRARFAPGASALDAKEIHGCSAALQCVQCVRESYSNRSAGVFQACE